MHQIPVYTAKNILIYWNIQSRIFDKYGRVRDVFVEYTDQVYESVKGTPGIREVSICIRHVRVFVRTFEIYGE
jgi:hypothetical protein